MLLTGTLSFQAFQQIRSYDNISVGIDTIKCFLGKIGEATKKIQSHQNQPSYGKHNTK